MFRSASSALNCAPYRQLGNLDGRLIGRVVSALCPSVSTVQVLVYVS